jgi:signal transduction histidine kinase
MGSGATPKRIVAALGATRTLDILLVGAAVALALVLVIARAPFLVVVLGVVLPLAAYARARNALGRLADRLILAEFREREALRATEEERARISREIHDEPLQTIAGVIAQLEDPESDRAVARQSLRAVAEQLRDLATELHPPVLDDLGLAPAIEFVARGAPRTVEVDIANHAGYGRAERPPVDVELAVYRIAAEAITNATRHAQAAHVSVAGSVACHAVEITIADDGCGISAARIEEAQRDGHLGITTMRRRALAIDGDLAIASPSDGGTEVTVRWTA